MDRSLNRGNIKLAETEVKMIRRVPQLSGLKKTNSSYNFHLDSVSSKGPFDKRKKKCSKSERHQKNGAGS